MKEVCIEDRLYDAETPEEMARIIPLDRAIGAYTAWLKQAEDSAERSRREMCQALYYKQVANILGADIP